MVQLFNWLGCSKTRGPVAEPINMTLVFDYETNPAENEEMTFSYFLGSLANCVIEIDTKYDAKRRFQVNMSSVVPVTEMYGNVTIFGIRWMNITA
ncbi:uncharacterized protein LOC131677210 isoform X2 [Topomyia yanbarensis]|uniref:uncharacterized protein LOC131677210 isoform X2 n=1 Tax=Topomyia yanbarensis TaxID=2498891 RepID=UPI00273A86AD|nr:uncharacterized protein LOC131677210 isoform X2 [Topomyia yanbarensis]